VVTLDNRVDHANVGLRFLRVLRLLSLPEILQYLSILHNFVAIRMSQIICLFLAIWLTSAGVIHLVGLVQVQNC
jgi:potassium large conductance calcium-activated channel subfamily M alpha protein 1